MAFKNLIIKKEIYFETHFFPFFSRTHASLLTPVLHAITVVTELFVHLTLPEYPNAMWITDCYDYKHIYMQWEKLEYGAILSYFLEGYNQFLEGMYDQSSHPPPPIIPHTSCFPISQLP